MLTATGPAQIFYFWLFQMRCWAGLWLHIWVHSLHAGRSASDRCPLVLGGLELVTLSQPNVQHNFM